MGLAKISKVELDYYPMKCRECEVSKKTVTGLKMHIKLIHMKVGKFQCKHCDFTANIKGSIQGHYRNKHPDSAKSGQGEDLFDFDERSSDAQTYSQEYWKKNWNIPTLQERQSLLAMLAEPQKKGKTELCDQQSTTSGKRKEVSGGEEVASTKTPVMKKMKGNVKRGRKRKFPGYTKKKDEV